MDDGSAYTEARDNLWALLLQGKRHSVEMNASSSVGEEEEEDHRCVGTDMWEMLKKTQGWNVSKDLGPLKRRLGRQGCCNGDGTGKSDEEPVRVGGRQNSTSLRYHGWKMAKGALESGPRRLCILTTRKQSSVLPNFEPYNKMKMSGRTRLPRTPWRLAIGFQFYER